MPPWSNAPLGSEAWRMVTTAPLRRWQGLPLLAWYTRLPTTFCSSIGEMLPTASQPPGPAEAPRNGKNSSCASPRGHPLQGTGKRGTGLPAHSPGSYSKDLGDKSRDSLPPQWPTSTGQGKKIYILPQGWMHEGIG